MAASTARPDSVLSRPALSRRVRGSRTGRTDAVVLERGTPGRVYALLALASLGLAGLSLLLPSTPTYDPWSWIIWGREIAHLDLVTTGGPSWKPLPALFTTVFSLFGSAAPDLWIVIARAGGFMAIFLAFRLAARLTAEVAGGPRASRVTPGGTARWGIAGWTAGLVAAAGVLTQTDFLRAVALANSEGLLVALVLWAIERHLDGHRRQALVLAFLAALLRPETWPFLGLYGLWLWFRDPDQRRLLVILAVLVPALWFLPEYWGSGNFNRAADRAAKPNPNSPAFAPDPFLEVLKDARPVLAGPLKLGVILGALAAAWAFVSRRRWAPAGILAGAAAWILLVAGMTAAGYSGNPRYILLGTSLLAVIGGLGFGVVVAFAGRGAARLRPGLEPFAAGALALVLLAGAWHWGVNSRVRNFERIGRALDYQADLRTALPGAIEAAGGRGRVLGCGAIGTGRYQVPMVAWTLDAHIRRVALAPAPGGTVLQARASRRASLDPPPPLPPQQRRVGRSGPWIAYQSCPPPTGAGA